jgi:hypothetical protein
MTLTLPQTRHDLTTAPDFWRDPVTPAYASTQLTAALESLAYVAYHADLGMEETSCLDHARATLRALRDDLGNVGTEKG